MRKVEKERREGGVGIEKDERVERCRGEGIGD